MVADGLRISLARMNQPDRVAADRRVGHEAAAERYADHGGAAADRERPEPAHWVEVHDLEQAGMQPKAVQPVDRRSGEIQDSLTWSSGFSRPVAVLKRVDCDRA
jgi:hypothetical protein